MLRKAHVFFLSTHTDTDEMETIMMLAIEEAARESDTAGCLDSPLRTGRRGQQT